jgi:hypothetical protein
MRRRLFIFLVMAHVHLAAASGQAPQAKILTPYIGTYVTQGQDRIRVLVVDDHLVSADGEAAVKRLDPSSSPNTYAAPGGLLFEFGMDDPGVVSRLTIHGPTSVTQARKVRVAGDVLGKYVGIYRLSGGFTFAVTLEENRLLVQGTGQAKVPMWPDSNDTFFVHQPGTLDLAILEFGANSAGGIVTVAIQQNGARDSGVRQ